MHTTTEIQKTQRLIGESYLQGLSDCRVADVANVSSR